jgi:hypothetical protein
MTSTNHYSEAERLLAKASQLEDGERFHYAKVYAEMAQAHATLAAVKAIRQIEVTVTQTDVLAPAAPDRSEPVERARRFSSASVEENLTRQCGA